LLVLDEPFAGLDALVREEFTQGILEVAGVGRPWTVFISSHDIDEVERLADWIGVINEAGSNWPNPFRRSSRGSAASRWSRRVTRECLHSPSVLAAGGRSGRTVSFVESRFVESECGARVRNLIPGARDISVTPMSLREIFIVLARVFRLADPQGGAR